MKAIVQDRYGSPEVLHLREIEDPRPGDDEILIRVRAAAVNAYDWHVMRGDPYLARLMAPAMFGRRGPRRRIRGRDVAGQVHAVGRNVTRFQPGDEVYGDLGNLDGAFAEYVCAPESLMDRKPAALSFEQAAAIPLAATTALVGLRAVTPGQRVLINGASGGVGTFAVQIAVAFGAEVTAVCSTRNVELVRSLGAQNVVDYTQADFTAGTRPYDLILDLVGNRSLTECRRALTPSGTLTLAGGGVSRGGSLIGPVGLIIRGQLAARFVRHRIRILSVTPGRENLATLSGLVETGQLSPSIDRAYQLSEVPDAIRYLETEHARAKVVITI